MEGDNIRHLIRKRTKAGVRFFWQPSATVKALGLCAEALGGDVVKAKARALELNRLADEVRRGEIIAAQNPPSPGTISKLIREYTASEEFAILKPRTRHDYAYYLGKIELDFGDLTLDEISPKIAKEYYKRLAREKSVTWAYHMLSTLRTLFSWAVSEDWIEANPALDVKIRAPKKRKVTWGSDEAAAYVRAGAALAWHSIVAMAHVFDSIGQSPVDVRTLLRKSYDGRAIDVSRTKTGVAGAPIPLFPTAVTALDTYLATQPAKLPDAPLFTNERTGKMWNAFTLNRRHREIRKAAGLRTELQLQDFRTTVLTEGGAAGATVDELRALGRHLTRDAGEHYVHPTPDYVEAAQEKRLARRRRLASKMSE